jgi:hypothetical protein
MSNNHAKFNKGTYRQLAEDHGCEPVGECPN